MEKDDALAVGGGAVLGFLAIKPTLAATGVASGLSAPGITSALASIGFGGMVGGVVTVAAFPLAGVGLVYGGWQLYKRWYP